MIGSVKCDGVMTDVTSIELNAICETFQEAVRVREHALYLKSFSFSLPSAYSVLVM